jgi:MFS family permease
MPKPNPPKPLDAPSAARGAIFALAVLFSMNLLNYVDRYVLAAVGKAIMTDLELEPGPFGWLGSAFIVVYTIASPIVGWMGDRFSRRKILAFGVGLWSVATVGTAFAANFHQMFLARALLGVGEASYGVVAPALLSDLFPLRMRGKVMGLFYLALPIGTAVGYATGGLVQTYATAHADAIRAWLAGVGLGAIAPYVVAWRAAFWVVGLPGLILAACGLLIRDPGRGASELHAEAGGTDAGPITPEEAAAHGAATGGAAAAPIGEGAAAAHHRNPTARDYLLILRTPSYLLNTAGMAAVTFTIGAYGHWMPSYFQYVHGTEPEFQLNIGIALAVAGLLGVLLGMWLPDRLQRLTRRAYLLWPAIAVLAAIPFGAAGLLAPGTSLALGLLFVASVLLTSCLGPCNTVTANVVPANRRAVGYALSIFLLHLFGDIPSPPLIGSLASELAAPAVRSTPVGRFFEAIGARPIDPVASAEVEGARGAEGGAVAAPGGHEVVGPMNLTAGMLVIIPILVLGSLCFFVGSLTLPRDQDRARAAGGGGGDHGIQLH